MRRAVRIFKAGVEFSSDGSRLGMLQMRPVQLQVLDSDDLQCMKNAIFPSVCSWFEVESSQNIPHEQCLRIYAIATCHLYQSAPPSHKTPVKP